MALPSLRICAIKPKSLLFVQYKKKGCKKTFNKNQREAPWLSGRASDSGARDRGFDPHSGRCVVSLSMIHLPPKKVLVIPRKVWLHPNMTEKLLSGT